MSAGRGTSDNGERPGAVLPLLRFIAVGTITGLGFGLVMAIVSNGFVLGVKALSSLREGQMSQLLRIGEVSFSFAPVVILLVAVAANLVVRRAIGIKRWHGPADAIHAAHRSDNELDVKSGFGSTLAAFISASGGASVGQYGPLVHFGATMGSFLRQTTGSTLTTDIFIGCGWPVRSPPGSMHRSPESSLRMRRFFGIFPCGRSRRLPLLVCRPYGSATPFLGQPISLICRQSALIWVKMLPPALVAGPVFGLLAVLFMLAIRYSAAFAARSGWLQLACCLQQRLAPVSLACLFQRFWG